MLSQLIIDFYLDKVGDEASELVWIRRGISPAYTTELLLLKLVSDT